MEELIKRFLAQGYGYGCGYSYGYGYSYGDGDGYGDGSGSGYGSGDGYGDGYGSGDGSGDGYGYGSGDGCGDGDSSGSGSGDGRNIKSFKGYPVMVVDGVLTVVARIEMDDDLNGVAIGWVLAKSFALQRTYVVKRAGIFAHGNTLQEAVQAVQEKVLEDKPVQERIGAFVEAFPLIDSFVSAQELFSWHHILTGSCLQGRRIFCQERGIDMDAEYTICQFIELTKDAYGGEIIRLLRERYKELQN